MLDFKKLFKKSNEEKEGQGLVEYALILALIAIVVIAVLTTLGNNVNSKFSTVSSALS